MPSFGKATEQDLLKALEMQGLDKHLRAFDGGWELLSDRPEEKPVRLDFASTSRQFKATLRSLREQPLFRALGSKGGIRPRVWDTTCGLAGDSLLLLHMGCSVVSSERNPLVALMLLRAYENWDDPLKDQWELLLRAESPSQWDVTYFDPMFNEPHGEALSRKEMRIFRSVVGEDKDAREVAQELRGLGKRLIIKRPLKGEALLPGPDFTQEGKAMRFDVYLPRPVNT